jgi:hypothetical protein
LDRLGTEGLSTFLRLTSWNKLLLDKLVKQRLVVGQCQDEKRKKDAHWNHYKIIYKEAVAS